jgi:DNA mismatch repair ATPase MutL
VFVRELLQNARDAGATAVAFIARSDGGTWRLSCRDDGEGMSYAHARRYLFALYASSKEQRRDQVGRFGVGFWSILRFEPARIIIRSRPRLS